jgi:hypothetical protein
MVRGRQLIGGEQNQAKYYPFISENPNGRSAVAEGQLGSQPPPRKWVQDVVFKLGETAIELMQRPASFNLAAVKEKIEAAIRAHEGGR